jgi:hypothetical protein
LIDRAPIDCLTLDDTPRKASGKAKLQHFGPIVISNGVSLMQPQNWQTAARDAIRVFLWFKKEWRYRRRSQQGLAAGARTLDILTLLR